jgi:hypothetical protein
MDKTPPNRMATPDNRGRPSKEDLEKRPAPEPAVIGPITEPAPVKPNRMGLRCPHCGRTETPRVLRTRGLERYVSCRFCGGYTLVIYNRDGVALTTQRL